MIECVKLSPIKHGAQIMVLDNDPCGWPADDCKCANQSRQVLDVSKHVGERDDVRAPVSLNVAVRLREIEERVIYGMTLSCSILGRLRRLNTVGKRSTTAEDVKETAIVAADIKH